MGRKPKIKPTGIPVTRAAVLKLRHELGPDASMHQLALFLGVGPERVRRLFTPHERKLWHAERLQTRRLRIPGLAAAQVKAAAQIFGKTPSAEQSGVSAKWQDYCGGYNRIVAMAGLVPLKNMQSAIGYVRRGTVCGSKSETRGHDE